jgi:zinc protease
MAQEVFDKDSMMDQATTLGAYESVGLSWQLSKDYVAHIQAVTVEQVQAVAQKYFIDKRLTIAELVPHE